MRNLLAAIFLSGCVHAPTPVPDVFDAGCDDACANMSALGCEGATGNAGPDREAGTKDDSTCEQACEDILASGLGAFDVDCIASADSCEEVDECNQ